MVQKKAMKVLFLLHQYFPHFYTGTELLTDNLSRYQRYLGVQTEVWAYNPLKTRKIWVVEETKYNGIPVKFFSHHNNDPLRDVKLFLNQKKNILSESILKDSKPDLIHVTQPSRLSDVVQNAKNLSIPYILTLTDYWLLCPTVTLMRKNGELCGGSQVDKNCLKYCFKGDKEFFNERWRSVLELLSGSEKVFFAAKFLKNIFEKNGIDTRAWVNIKHGYNPNGSKVRIKDRYYRFAFTGTLQPSKGAHLAIKAFRKINDKSIRLVVYGEAKYEVKYSNYCLKLSEGDKRIEFRGKYDHTKLTEEFKDIDCILVPSNWFEPFPFTLISAVSYGFDVIGARIGGIPEIIGEKNPDYLFEPGNIEDLSEKMRTKIKQGKNKEKKLFYEQSLEAEAFKYFQIYNLVAGKT